MRHKLSEHHRCHVGNSLPTCELLQIHFVIEEKLSTNVSGAGEVVAAHAFPDRVNLVVVLRLQESAIGSETRAHRLVLQIVLRAVDRSILCVRRIGFLRQNFRLQEAVRVVLKQRWNVRVVIVVFYLIIEKRSSLPDEY